MAMSALSSPQEMRVLVGVVVQPFVAGALAFAAFPLLFVGQDGQTLAGGYAPDATGAALSVALGAGLVAGLVALVAVLPTAFWVMKRRSPSLAETLMFGIGFGILPYVLLAIAAGGTYGVTGLLRGVAFSSLLGLAGAAVFWAIAIRPRPLRGTV